MNSAPPLWRHPEFSRGFRDMRGVSLGIGAWGMVTGIAMIKSGMGMVAAVAMALILYAGSAQLAALPLMVQGAPLWVILSTTFCVNLRFVIFSAGWRPYFQSLPFWQRMTIGYFTGDVNYITFMRRFPRPEPMRVQLAYYAGASAIGWLAWQGMQLLGMVLADVIPTRWGLGFVGTLAMLSLVGGLLIDRATWAAAAVAGCAAMATIALPYHLYIVVGIAAAVAVGVMMDHFSPSKAVPSTLDGGGDPA